MLFLPAPDTAGNATREPLITEIGAWYPQAVLYRVDVRAFCDANHDSIGDFEGLIRKLPYLESFGVTCIDLCGLERHDHADFIRFRSAARDAGIRVLVEVAGDSAHRRDDIPSWLESGADGIVLTRPPASRANGSARCVGTESDGTRRRCLSFFRVNGVPVPCAGGDESIGELGAFRAQAVPAIIEGIRRESGVPLLALLVRLALRVASNRLRACDEEDRHAVADPHGDNRPLRLARMTDGLGPRLNLLHALLFALPGPPLLIFGDEIGMDDLVCDSGGNWSPMRWRRGQDGDAISVQSQNRFPASLLNRVRTLARLRGHSKALSCGTTSPVGLGAGPGVGFLRECGREVILVVANLSAAPLVVECDLSGHEGKRVQNLTGDARLQRVGDGWYPVALGPYGWHWLHLVTP